MRWILGLAALLAIGTVAGFKTWKWVSVPADAPVIGVSLDTAWHSRLGLTNRTYEIALARVGGRLYEIRPGRATPEEILNRIDSLMLAGGGDVDPALYGGPPDSARLVDRGRDEFEIELIRGALDRNMPILGICRGVQILNVAQGGGLRNLRANPTLSDTHGISLDSLEAHDIEIAPGSKLEAVFNARELTVNSFHGQAVGKLGEGLRASAHSPDGVIEAVERGDRPFVVAVQWHPEILSLEDPERMALFRELIEHAKRYRTKKQR
jgi:gamma-glutamyl-gamma-aminobutyrate hydrolase PuuD